MPDACDSPHQSLAIEASLQGESYGFGRERLRLPMGLEASFGWLRRYRPAVGQRVSLSAAALDSALASGDEPLDGRTLTAWFLARRRW